MNLHGYKRDGMEQHRLTNSLRGAFTSANKKRNRCIEAGGELLKAGGLWSADEEDEV